MRLVLDNNVLFSLTNPNSVASYLFSLIDCEFFAPEFIKFELEEHKIECLEKSGLSEHEFEIRLTEVEESIKFFKSSKYKEFLKKAKSESADSDDIDFLALALFINASVWSNDSHFKLQSSARVFTTKDLVRMFLAGKI